MKIALKLKKKWQEFDLGNRAPDTLTGEYTDSEGLNA